MTIRMAIMDADGRPVPEPDTLKWAQWMAKDDRHIGKTILRHAETGLEVMVSTVFLGTDHSFGHGEPTWFETMIFGLEGEDELYQRRYTTIEEATRGHEEACRRLGPMFKAEDGETDPR